MNLQKLAVRVIAPSILLLTGCATVVADDYSAEFSGHFLIADDSGDQPLNHKVLTVEIHDGVGTIIASDSTRPEVWLDLCRSQINNFAHEGDDGHVSHEMLCRGSDRFAYLFVHGKPGMKVSESMLLKLYKDRHDITSESGYVLRRYIPNMITVTYALDRQ